MSKHPTKFDEHTIKLHRNETAGMPRYAGLGENWAKLRSGKVNESKGLLSKESMKAIDDYWKEVFLKTTGFETYDAMRKSVNEELGRKFA